MLTGKQKLYTFGCSFTYGHGFPDCEDLTPDSSPSKYAWPTLLAESLDLPYENLVSPGCSPMELSRRFLQNVERITENDIVVIEWPYFNRTCVFLNDTYEGMAKLMPGLDDVDPGLPYPKMNVRNFYAFYTNDIHSMQTFMLFCQLVDAECERRNIKVLHKIFCKQDYKQLRKARKSKDPGYGWFTVDIDTCCFDMFQGTKLKRYQRIFNKKFGNLPDGHRDQDHHILWAESIKRKLVRKKYISECY